MPAGTVASATMTPEQLDKIFSKVERGLGAKKTHDLDELIEKESKSRGTSRATTPSEIFRPQPPPEVLELREAEAATKRFVVLLHLAHQAGRLRRRR